MKEFILYAVLIFGFVWYIWMLIDIWKFRKNAKSEWEQYWDNVFNNTKNNKQ